MARCSSQAHDPQAPIYRGRAWRSPLVRGSSDASGAQVVGLPRARTIAPCANACQCEERHARQHLLVRSRPVLHLPPLAIVAQPLTNSAAAAATPWEGTAASG